LVHTNLHLFLSSAAAVEEVTQFHLHPPIVSPLRMLTSHRRIINTGRWRRCRIKTIKKTRTNTAEYSRNNLVTWPSRCGCLQVHRSPPSFPFSGNPNRHFNRLVLKPVGAATPLLKHKVCPVQRIRGQHATFDPSLYFQPTHTNKFRHLPKPTSNKHNFDPWFNFRSIIQLINK
ncbi:hypothetical protein V8G54_032943, partial [Vigna mungo]